MVKAEYGVSISRETLRLLYKSNGVGWAKASYLLLSKWSREERITAQLVYLKKLQRIMSANTNLVFLDETSVHAWHKKQGGVWW